MSRVEIVSERDEWNELVERETGAFPQLWEWGEVRATLGWQPVRVVVRDAAGRLTGATQMVVERQPIVGWGLAHLPRGPFGIRTPRDLSEFFEALRPMARRHRIGTLWLDPPWQPEDDLGRALTEVTRNAPKRMEPWVCRVVDLAADDLWKGVRRKHREWIRKAEKRGVEVAWYDRASPPDAATKALDDFLVVYRRVTERHQIHVEPRGYYDLLWRRFRDTGHGSIVLARHEGATVGAMLQLTCGQEMTFYQGGQTDEGAELGVHKLLIWRSMERAKELGLRRYNMWGSDLPGLAHFKAGFGADEEAYVGTRSMAVRWPADLLVQAAHFGSRAVRRLPVPFGP